MNKLRYILFHKPYDVLSQFTSDTHNTLMDYNLPKSVYPVGRLDKNSEGLLLLSNDGPFIKKFLDFHERQYWVQVEGLANKEQISKLSNGIIIKEGLTKKAIVDIIDDPKLYQRSTPIRFRKNKPTSWLSMTLTEGKNRQVRKMTAAVGLPTLRLFRSRLGKLDYSKLGLKLGQWKEVTKKDII